MLATWGGKKGQEACILAGKKGLEPGVDKGCGKRDPWPAVA